MLNAVATVPSVLKIADELESATHPRRVLSNNILTPEVVDACVETPNAGTLASSRAWSGMNRRADAGVRFQGGNTAPPGTSLTTRTRADVCRQV